MAVSWQSESLAKHPKQRCLTQQEAVSKMTGQEAYFAAARREMLGQISLHTSAVSEQFGISSLTERVIKVIGKVPRHEFVPLELQIYAYLDQPLPIGFGKTISQPFIVALMTDLLDIQAHDRVLEVGTGLGYQAAILANLAKEVYSVEIIEELAQQAKSKLHRQGYRNIALKIGDGSSGWPEYAPFNKIIVTAAPELIPVVLLRQLTPGGKMVIPAGLEDSQQLIMAKKNKNDSITTEEILPVCFSSLTVTH
jgi:protein-L-isoaspartate(D-aspartate) O-methyltransferase